MDLWAVSVALEKWYFLLEKCKNKFQKKKSKKKFKKKNSKKKIQIILSLTEEENFKVKIEKKNWKKIQIRRIEKKKFDFFFFKKNSKSHSRGLPLPHAGVKFKTSKSKETSSSKHQIQNLQKKKFEKKNFKKKSKSHFLNFPQNLGVILRKTTGFGGLGPCPLDAQWKNKEFLKNLAGVRPLGGYCPPSAKVRRPRSDIYIHTHIYVCVYIYMVYRWWRHIHR